MRDFRDAKAMGTSLRKALAARSIPITHSDSLELISNAFGFDNWNILASKIETAERPALATAAAPSKAGDAPGTLYCSFCGKSQHQVLKLIAGPKVFICDECVALCDGILEEEDSIGQLLKEESAGRSLSEVLAESSDNELLRIQGFAAKAAEHAGKTSRIIQAILSGAQNSSIPAADRVLEMVFRQRSEKALKKQLSDMTERKAGVDRLLAEITRALAARGQ